MTQSSSALSRAVATAIAALALVAVVLWPPAIRAQQDAGRSVFARVCAECHGESAAGGSGPALVPFGRTKSDLLAIVRQGGPQMPALSSQRISDEEVAALGSYLRSLSAPATRSGAPAPRNTYGTLTIDKSVKVTPVSDAMLANPSPGDWLNWRRTQDGWGYSPLGQIDRSNVRGLTLS